MSDQIIFSEPQRVMNREYCTASDGTEWVRRIRRDGTTTEWEQYVPDTPYVAEASPRLCLWLVRQKQPGGPYHWLLAIAGDEGGPGQLYQVKGDALYMYYVHATNVDVFRSDSYYDSYNLAQLDEDGRAWVDYVAISQPPPSAENVASIAENCQGWTVRVLAELEARAIVPYGTVLMVRGMMESLG
ncbi:hypothetical protein F4678DRAFT_461481 [Xylaria arbuscula]|nr:hypothetical protein F4678DRAFT_461481 [Xylaria arbuscula]